MDHYCPIKSKSKKSTEIIRNQRINVINSFCSKLFLLLKSLRSLIAAVLSSAAGPHLVPVAHGSAAGAAARTAVVYPGVVFALRRAAASAECAISVHIVTHARLRAGQLVGARLPTSSDRAAVDPVGLLNLIGSTAQ